MLEDQLVTEYIGNNAEKIENDKLNWVAAILGQEIGPIWFFYRKSGLLGVGFIILTLIIAKITNALEISKAYYIMFFIYLFSANKLYLWDVRRKVRKIMQENSNLDEQQLIEIVRKKGGTSTKAAIIYGVIFAIIIALYFMIAYYVVKTMFSL